MKIPKISTLMNSIDLFKKINNLIDVARMPLERSTAYVVGDVVHTYALPSNLYLECIQAGTTSYYALNLSNVSVKDELTDGTVIWRVADVKSGGGGHEIVESVPDVEDAEDNVVYFVPDEDNSPMSESTLAASITNLIAEFQTFKDSIDYVVDCGEEKNENGNVIKWYRKWKSGWLEQGGEYNIIDTWDNWSPEQTINFIKPFGNDLYTLTTGQTQLANGGYGTGIQIHKYNNKFTYLTYNSTNGGSNKKNWYACGMGEDE